MKKLFSLMMTILLASQLFSQNPQLGSYEKVPENEKFVGVWKTVDSKLNIKLIMTNSKERVIDENYYMDQIIGDIIITKSNGSIVTLKKVIYNGIAQQYNLRAIFNDPKSLSGRAVIGFPDPKNLDELTVTIIPTQNMFPKTARMSLSVPRNFKLIRVK
ncbi:hypothetical protein EON78_02740 [bacterium]|nr:MAG: hypothetical protein EON78_02740 [bacterium]